MQKITLNLTIDEINVIIKALSERPFREVYELVGKVHAQSNSQISLNKAPASKNRVEIDGSNSNQTINIKP